MDDDSFEEFDDRPSKSEIKREMHALQGLAQRLVDLTPTQLAKVPMPEVLEIGVKDAQRFKKEAKRRQMQYLGKVMRKLDPAPIEAALAEFDTASAESINRMRALEGWRDQLIEQDSALTEFLDKYPHIDAQPMRQLIRNARANKSGAPRALFRFIRDQIQ